MKKWVVILPKLGDGLDRQATIEAHTFNVVDKVLWLWRTVKTENGCSVTHATASFVEWVGVMEAEEKDGE